MHPEHEAYSKQNTAISLQAQVLFNKLMYKTTLHGVLPVEYGEHNVQMLSHALLSS